MTSVCLVNANALSIPLADCSVQMVATSPPYYGLRDYSVSGQLGLEQTPEEYVANMVAVFREVRRVLRDDGVLFLNLGDSYNGSGGSGGDYNPGGLKEGQPRYPGRNIDYLKPKDLIGVPWRVAFALQADGWWLRSDIIWAKPNPMPESVTDRPTKAHEYIFLLTKSSRYYWDADAVRQKSNNIWSIDIDWRKQRVMASGGALSGGIGNGTGDHDSRNIRTVWNIATSPYKGAHFATCPPKLVEPMIKAGSKVGDIVLDPFAGSGTTLMVARQFGRHAVGLDLSFPYLHEQARKRLELDKLAAWSCQL